MTFDEILTQVVEILQRQGRVSYGALKRRFTLDDDYLWDLKEELINAQRVALDENGKVLVWVGESEERRAKSVERGTEYEERQAKSVEREGIRQESSVAARSTLSAPGAEGERRPLTIMSCGFFEADQGQASHDFEELGSLVRQCQTTCAAVIKRYEGYIAQYLSDGLLVYFGYPAAHEDDARRAVLAGLEIVETIRGRGTGDGEQVRRHSLQVRVGIHTGMVIFNTVGGADRRERVALGETPKVAARIQAMADPDTVVLGAATYRLVRDYFACQSLGEQKIRGLPSVSEIYRVTAESSNSPRAETITTGTTLPLIGREEELHLLLKRWEQVQEGHGQVVLLSGEAGIGKSRLLAELRNRLATPEGSRFVLHCSPYYQQSAFHPLLDLAQRALQFAPGDSPQEKHRKLERALGAFHLEEALPLLATFLGLPAPQSPLVHLSPQKQRETVMQVVVSSWMTVAERQPLFVVWEDLQWADPSTLDLLRLFIDQIPRARIFMVLTFRPDFTPTWPVRTHLTPLTLDRLGQEQAQTIIEKVAGQKTLPAEIVRQIVLKTDGVPLFIEELTKMVLESGLVKAHGDRYELTGPLPPLAVPATLQESLFARLDRLGEAREIAQIGALLGREFSYDVLKAVSASEESHLQAALATLVDAAVLHRRGVAPHTKYVFRHALIQDAAYQSLLKNRRQQYHQRIARVLEGQFSATAGEQPELIAHHYAEAGLDALAVPFWQQAGQRALARSAFAEAISHFSRGLEALQTVQDSPDRVLQELELRSMLGPALMAVKGYGAPEVEHTYVRALELCRQSGETPRLLQVLSGLQMFYLARGEIRTARELGERCLGLARQAQNPDRLVQVHLVLGSTLFQMGELDRAHEHHTQGLACYHRSAKQGSYRALQDPGVGFLCYLALILWCRGYSDQAVEKSAEALATAEKLARPFSLAIAQSFAAQLYSMRQEWDLVLKYAEATITLASEQELSLWGAYASIYRGWAFAEQGRPVEGIAEIERGLALARATGAEVVRPWLLSALAKAYLILGQSDRGVAVVEEALGVIEAKGERFAEVELYRLKGELLLVQEVKSQNAKGKRQKSEIPEPKSQSPNPLSEVEACFLKAIALAQQRDMRLWELRATVSLARLWQTQGKNGEARQLLAPIFQWFTEGEGTKDLQDARRLLITLEAV